LAGSCPLDARRCKARIGAIVRTVVVLGFFVGGQARADLIGDWIASFEGSDFVFERGRSNVPFQPLAWLSATGYKDTELDHPAADGGNVTFGQSTLSQTAVVPFLLGPRDAVLIGEWLSTSRFEGEGGLIEDFSVHSAAVPIAWIRQLDPDWQVGAFVMPLGYKATLDDADWRWETLGGAMVRWVQSDRLWWAFGAFAEVGPGEDTILPYVGASWSYDERWTLSAIMPWPAVLYAPTPHLLFRLGLTPTGTAWNLVSDGTQVNFELDAWDAGIKAEWRLARGQNYWLGVEAGVSGLSGLRVSGGRWHGAELDVGTAPFVRLTLAWRPGVSGNS
jgi:hypothetical protein